MKVIISGAGGFLGKHLLKQMIDRQDYSILALSSRPDQLSEFRQSSNVNIMGNDEFFQSDSSLDNHILINLAFVRSTDFSIVKENCEFTFNLLDKCFRSGVEKVINISSQSVYSSKRSEPAKETDLVKLDTLYDMGKYYLENWISEFCQKNGLDYLNLRIGSLVGPGFAQRITSRLVKQALEEGSITVNMNGQLFSYTHVHDMSRAIIFALTCEDCSIWNRKLNVGTFERYTLLDISNHIEKLLNARDIDLAIIASIVEPNGMNNSLDSSNFRELTGWSCQYSLSAIIEEDIEYWSKRL